MTYHFKFFKGCLPQMLLGPFLKTLSSHIYIYFLHSFTVLQKILRRPLWERFFAKIVNGIYPLTVSLKSSIIRGLYEKLLVNNRTKVKRLIMIVADKKNKYTIETCPSNINLFKVNNINTSKRCEIFSKLTIKTPERRHWRGSGLVSINFEHILHIFLAFLLLTLNK